MSGTLSGLPVQWLSFDQNGFRLDAAGSTLYPDGLTDLIVMSHGWKTDQTGAASLYGALLSNLMGPAGAAKALGGRKLGVSGVLWPSFDFNPDLSFLTPVAPVGAAAAAGPAGGAQSISLPDVSQASLRQQAERTAMFLGIADVQGFVTRTLAARGGGGAADDLVDELRAVAPPVKDASNAAAEHSELFQGQGRGLVGALSRPAPAWGGLAPARAADPEATAAIQPHPSTIGQSAAFTLNFGPVAAISKLLNQFTYFEMKRRAGIVGAKLAALLDGDAGLQRQAPRLHLVGHSFGGRLVTACASALTSVSPASMTLLQAAFSQNGFGTVVGSPPVTGAFRNVVIGKRVKGPITVTHTLNDQANGVAYPLASRVNGCIAAAFNINSIVGGPSDVFGAIGANGALSLMGGESVSALLAAGSAPALQDGVINNLQADAVIHDHMDVTNVSVAQMLRRAIGL